MSKREDKILSLAGMDPTNVSSLQLHRYFNAYLKQGMHGIGFSAYEEGQKPGDELSLEQVQRRMAILKPSIKWVRSFSCLQGNELIPTVAKQMGIKTLVGAWLGDDLEKNEEEVEGLIKLAKEGYVDIAAVGNEVMYRKDLTEEQLLGYIQRVKDAVPGVPVGYVDAYYEFEDRPAITEICDVILANCYPFWEGCAIEYSLLYMKDMFRRTQKVAAGKKVIITETGWPNQGENSTVLSPLRKTLFATSSTPSNGVRRTILISSISRHSMNPGKSAPKAMSARSGVSGIKTNNLNIRYNYHEQSTAALL